MKRQFCLYENYFEYVEGLSCEYTHDGGEKMFDPIAINRYLSAGWDSTGHDYADDDDLFYNCWEEEDDSQTDETTTPEKVVLLEDYQLKRDFNLALSKIFTRGRTASDALKYLYQDRCQVCGHKIDLGHGQFYSETHHIQPRSEGGPDVPGNMIVVCRNCHILFDHGYSPGSAACMQFHAVDLKAHHRANVYPLP
jgi:hypothetical protein